MAERQSPLSSSFQSGNVSYSAGEFEEAIQYYRDVPLGEHDPLVQYQLGLSHLALAMKDNLHDDSLGKACASLTRAALSGQFPEAEHYLRIATEAASDRAAKRRIEAYGTEPSLAESVGTHCPWPVAAAAFFGGIILLCLLILRRERSLKAALNSAPTHPKDESPLSLANEQETQLWLGLGSFLLLTTGLTLGYLSSTYQQDYDLAIVLSEGISPQGEDGKAASNLRLHQCTSLPVVAVDSARIHVIWSGNDYYIPRQSAAIISK